MAVNAERHEEQTAFILLFACASRRCNSAKGGSRYGQRRSLLFPPHFHAAASRGYGASKHGEEALLYVSVPQELVCGRGKPW